MTKALRASPNQNCRLARAFNTIQYDPPRCWMRQACENDHTDSALIERRTASFHMRPLPLHIDHSILIYLHRERQITSGPSHSPKPGISCEPPYRIPLRDLISYSGWRLPRLITVPYGLIIVNESWSKWKRFLEHLSTGDSRQSHHTCTAYHVSSLVVTTIRKYS